MEPEASRSVHDLKSTWCKQTEITKEPYLCSFLRNLLLYFPGNGISKHGLDLHLVASAFLHIMKNFGWLNVFVIVCAMLN